MSGPFKLKKGKELKDFFKTLTVDNDKTDLPDLSGTADAEEVDLSKKSGLGPRTDFGGVKNPELDPSREPEDTAE